MSKRSRRRRRQPARSASQPPPVSKAPIHRTVQIGRGALSIARSIWIAIGAAGALASIAGGYAFVKPSVAVDSSSNPLDEFHPYSEPFTIANNGNLSLTSIRIACWPHNMTWTFVNNGIDRSSPGVRWSAFDLDTLSTGEKRTFACDVVTPVDTDMTIKESEFAVVVKFRPIPFITWRIPKIFIFDAKRHSDNRLHWERQPLKETPLKSYPPDL